MVLKVTIRLSETQRYMRATLKYNKVSIVVNIMCSKLDFQILFILILKCNLVRWKKLKKHYTLL